MTTLVKMVFGSHLYGLNTENSDKDYKGVFMPSFEEILLQDGDKQYKQSTGNDASRNTAEDTDLDMYSLHKFLDLACKGETVALDMLHAPRDKFVEAHPIWHELQGMRNLFYTRNLKAFVGYVKRQADKYGIKGSRVNSVERALNAVNELIKNHGEHETLGDHWRELPQDDVYLRMTYKEQKNDVNQYFYEVCGKMYQLTLTLENFQYKMQAKYDGLGERAKLAAQNEGIDWKAVTHALRAGYQAKEIYLEGDITFPLRYRDFLLDVKQGNLDYKTEVEPILEDLVEEVQNLANESNYPEKVDRELINGWLVDTYKKHFGITWSK